MIGCVGPISEVFHKLMMPGVLMDVNQNRFEITRRIDFLSLERAQKERPSTPILGIVISGVRIEKIGEMLAWLARLRRVARQCLFVRSLGVDKTVQMVGQQAECEGFCNGLDMLRIQPQKSMIIILTSKKIQAFHCMVIDVIKLIAQECLWLRHRCVLTT